MVLIVVLAFLLLVWFGVWATSPRPGDYSREDQDFWADDETHPQP